MCQCLSAYANMTCDIFIYMVSARDTSQYTDVVNIIQKYYLV